MFDLKALAADEKFAGGFKREFGPLFGGATNGDFLKKLDSLSFDGILKGSDAPPRIAYSQRRGDRRRRKESRRGGPESARATLQKMPRVPKEVLDAIGAVKFSVEGTKVNASGEVKADAVTQWIDDEYNYDKKQRKSGEGIQRAGTEEARTTQTGRELEGQRLGRGKDRKMYDRRWVEMFASQYSCPQREVFLSLFVCFVFFVVYTSCGQKRYYPEVPERAATYYLACISG